MGAFETEVVNGATIKYYQDEDAQDPRKDCEQAAVIVCSHSHYSLGDREPTSDEMDAVRRGGFDMLERYLKLKHGAIAFTKVGLLDHSGLHMYDGGDAHWSDTQGWDSGTIGFAYVTKGRADTLGIPDARAAITAEIEEYDQYLRGDVYGYVIDVEGEEVDACWGFFGFEYCQGEARSVAENARTRAQAAWVKELV